MGGWSSPNRSKYGSAGISDRIFPSEIDGFIPQSNIKAASKDTLWNLT